MTRTVLKKKRLGAGKVSMLIGVAAVGALAFGAYKMMFQRPGEAAIQLIPADAHLVVTLDTTPSEEQLPTFKRIYAALDNAGIAKKLDEAMTGMFNKSPLGRELRPQIARSFAFAYMKSGGKDEMAMFSAVNDVAKVSDALSKGAKKVSDQPPTYRIEEMNSFCSVIGTYLVFAQQEDTLKRIEDVRGGKEPSVASLPAYQQARAALPKDANLMVFASPDGLKEFQKAVAQKSFSGMEWMSFGATVRDDGIAFDFRGPMDSKASAALKAMAQIPSVDGKLLNKYPAGAYGLMAFAQPAKYWTAFEEELRKDKTNASGFYQGLAEFERETGMSVEKDVLPAFEGDFSLAVYPGPSGKAEDLDILVMIDDSNGANSIALADKVRAFVQKKAAENKEKISFTESKIGDSIVWEIDADTRKKAIDGMKSGASGPVLDGKTLVYAQIGNGVVISSSRGLISKAIEAAGGNGSNLASDPAFIGMSSRLTEGSQGNMMVSIRRILEALRPQLEESMKNAPMKPDDIIELFGAENTGWVQSMQFDGQIASGNMFLPLNYEKAILLMGEGMKALSPPAGMDSGMSPTDPSNM